MKRRMPLVKILFVVFVLLLIWRVIPLFFVSSAKDIVEEFYTYEQDGDFGSAWNLFHPTMKERFAKNAFVTERSHIYGSHYSVSTFSFEVIETEKLQTWKTSGKTFKDVQRVRVEQIFYSKFGVFTVIQDVYAVKEDDEWRLIWEFKDW